MLLNLNTLVSQMTEVLRILIGIETDAEKLVNICYIEDCEAFLELFGKFLYILFVAQWEDNSGNLMVLASSQLLSNSSDADDFTESCDFSSHSEVA